MEKVIKAVVSVVPGPVLAWVGQWSGIFRDTYMVRPHDTQVAANELIATANALATVATVILVYLLFNTGARTLKRCAIVASATSALCVPAFFAFRSLLQGSGSWESVESIYLAYDVTTVSFLVAVPLAILFSALYQFNSRND